MITRACNANTRVILLEPTPHRSPVTDGPPEVTLEEVNRLTLQYSQAMRQVALKREVEFVPLFATFLEMEQRLAGEASLYADEVHLSTLGDLLYSKLVYQYLDLE